MRSVASHQSAASGQSLPVIDLNQWAISQSGRLHFNGRAVTANARQNPENIDPLSAENILQFRASLLTAETDTISAALDGATEENRQPLSSLDQRSSPTMSGTAKSKRTPSPSGRLLISGLVAVGLAVMGWILINAANTSRSGSDAVTKLNQPKPTASIFDPADSPANTAVNSDTAPGRSSLVPLESFQDRSGDESVSAAAIESAVGQAGDFSLQSLMPAVPGFEQPDPLAKPLIEANAAPSGGQDQPAKPSDLSVERLDPLAADDDPGPDESPQPTRMTAVAPVGPVSSIKLPPTTETDVVTALSANPDGSFRLQFPFQVPLGLRDAESGREIIDVNQQVAVATIQLGPAGMQHSWTTSASKTTSSASLIHGRLKTKSNEVVYLRPTIEADPLPIDLRDADIRPTWDLLGPMPPRVTRLSIELQLPKEVEEGWLEPMDPASPRRSRGVAVLTPAEGESVALGIRFDLRGGRKLSCRIRYAARLDPEAAWQLVSRPLLEQWADQLASQSELIRQQLTRVAAIYSQADSGGRRALATGRDQLEARGKTIREISQRLTRLQALVAKLEAGGRMTLRVWVEWPDSQQTLLETK